MNFLPIQTFGNYIDAHILMGRMQEEGIQCWLKDENTVTIDPILTNAVGGIKLMVAEYQLEAAMRILRHLEQETKNRLSCPKCNSHNIHFVSTPRKASNWLSVIVGFLFTSYAVPVDKTWHCFDCGAEFKEPVEHTKEKLN
jgi:ribosomal protein L37AE/L43A